MFAEIATVIRQAFAGSKFHVHVSTNRKEIRVLEKSTSKCWLVKVEKVTYRGA